MIKQISIFASNEPGQVVKATNVLSENNIDMRAMCVADTQDFGIIRLIVNDTARAKEVLKSHKCVVSVTDVLGIKVPDKPGALTKSLDLLSENGVNIDYMYAFITVSREHACLVLRVQDIEAAEKILIDNGVELITQEEIENL